MEALSSLTLRRKERERESDVTLSHSTHTTCLFLVVFDHFVVLSFSFPSCRLAQFLLFFVLSNRSLYFILFHRSGIFCFVISSFAFVVFLLSLIREQRGALLFALNEESAAKVIAADSSQLTVLF